MTLWPKSATIDKLLYICTIIIHAYQSCTETLLCEIDNRCEKFDTQDLHFSNDIRFFLRKYRTYLFFNEIWFSTIWVNTLTLWVRYNSRHIHNRFIAILQCTCGKGYYAYLYKIYLLLFNYLYSLLSNNALLNCIVSSFNARY